jgi:hypothetical protein
MWRSEHFWPLLSEVSYLITFDCSMSVPFVVSADDIRGMLQRNGKYKNVSCVAEDCADLLRNRKSLRVKQDENGKL